MARKSPKQRGTEFETACVEWLRWRLGDERIERRALHGSKDMGDIFGLYAHGLAQGIAECKAVKKWGPAMLAKWQEQTEAERCNADADFALLVVKTPGVGARHLGETRCFCTGADLHIMRGEVVPIREFERARGVWREITLEDACQMIEGGESDWQE